MTGGDVLMDRSQAADIDPFAGIVPSLADADIALVNIEMAISERGEPADKKYVFRAPPSAADRLAAAGIDVANLANNHAADYDVEGLTDTVALLEAAGVATVGAGANRDAAYRHRLLVLPNDVRVAFVGTSMVVPLGFAATGSRPGISSAYQPERVLDAVRAAALDAEVVVVTVHWGIERKTCPDERQRGFARELLRNGASVVVGHHPHVLQPVEHDAEAGTLVAYSLGNFVWHYRTGITGETGVLQIDFDGDEITDWQFHPHLLDSNGAPVPVAEGSRMQRSLDIVAGDCERHEPAPLPPPTTTTEAPTATTSPQTATTTAPPATTSPPTTAPADGDG